MACDDQYRATAFAQLTYRESLYDIAACLSGKSAKRSTRADANEARDWRIHASFAQRMIEQACKLYMVTTLNLPALEIWGSYRGRADCENRIKELKADFGLDSCNVNDFYATEAALGFAMLAYNLMSLFRQAVLRGSVQQTLATLHHKVFVVGAFGTKTKAGDNTTQ